MDANTLYAENVQIRRYGVKNKSESNIKEKREKQPERVGKRPSNLPMISKELSAYIIYILKKYSSYDHPLSKSDLLKKITSEPMKLFANETEELNICAATILNHLDSLYELSAPFDYNSYNPGRELMLQLYGGVIMKFFKDEENSTRAKPKFIQCHEAMLNEYEELDESDEDYEENADIRKSNKKTYYYFKSIFTEEELLIMESCIETNPYLSTNDNRKLIDKLHAILPNDIIAGYDKDLNKSSSFNQHISDTSAKLLGNITTLTQYIRADYQIEINYGKYIFNNKFKQPELKSKKGINNWQRIDPVAIIQANGFYYLIAHTDKSKSADDVIAYRIDRIIDINAHTDPVSGKLLTIKKDIIAYKEKFSAIDYLKTHPVMYAGDKTDIRLLVKDSKEFPVINSLIDTFGTDIRLYPLSEAEAQNYLKSSLSELEDKGERWYTVHLNHSIDGTILWAKQHIESARILSPDKAADELIKAVTAGLELYRR